jgi:hypothetical protein
VGEKTEMKCPICGNEMLKGGLIANSISVGWVPIEQFDKKGLKRLVCTEFRTIGKPNVLLNQTTVPNAYFCKECNKVMGIFDVTNYLNNFGSK